MHAERHHGDWAPPDGNVGAAGPRLHRMVPPYGGHGPGKSGRAFRAQPYAIALATGVLVAIVLRQFLDLAWGLAILNGLAAGGLALALSVGGDLAGGWFDATDNRSRSGVRGLTWSVMVAPALLVHRYVELRPPTRSRSPCCSCSPRRRPMSSAASWRLWSTSTATGPCPPIRDCIASLRRPPRAMMVVGKAGDADSAGARHAVRFPDRRTSPDAVASRRSDRLQSRVARRAGPNGAYEEIPDA